MSTNIFGRSPNQVPFNSDLGSLAYQSHDGTILKNVDIKSGTLNGTHTGTGTLSQLSISSTLDIGTKIDIKPYDDISGGTISFEGSEGQLFSVSNNLSTGSIFSVNDISGIPSIDVNAIGTVRLAPYNGSVSIAGNGYNVPDSTVTVNATSVRALSTTRYGSNWGTGLYTTASGGSISSPTALGAVSAVGVWESAGFDGVDYRRLAMIEMGSSGTVTKTSSPGFIKFSTTPVGSTAVSERVRILADGKIAIGSSSASFPIDITYSNTTAYSTTSSNGNCVRIVNYSPGSSNISAGIFFQANGANVGAAQASINLVENPSINATGHLAFSTRHSASWGERLRILSSGGITFNGDTATANALDDYEEGTWTPTTFTIGAQSPTINSATYTKVGKLITLQIDFGGSLTYTGGNLVTIYGIPFANGGSGELCGGNTGAGGSNVAALLRVRSNGTASGTVISSGGTINYGYVTLVIS